MSLSFNLFRLQQTDTRLSHAKARDKAIKEALENDAETQSARLQYREAEEGALRADSAMRGAEYETQTTRIKIQQAESSLYGGRVSNTKELQDLQNDVESLKRHLAVLEDSELEAMFAAEKAAETNKTAQRFLQETLADAEIRMRDLVAEQQKLETEIPRLESERQAIVAGIDRAALSDYEALFTQKRGLAVATLSEGACSACGALLTPAQRQAVHVAEKLMHCPSCGRLLYGD